jgi:hypothetical protein
VGVAFLLLIGPSGCLGLWGKKQSQAKRVLGVDDPRLKEMKLEDMDAEAAQPRAGLRLVLRTDKTEYRMDDPILVEVRVQNATGATRDDKAIDIPVYLEPFAKTPGGGEAEWLFKFEVRSGKDDKPVYRSPEFGVPEADRAGYYHFATLPPQSFVGREFGFPPARRRDWLKPGRYTFRAAYIVSDDYPYVILNRHFTSTQVELLGSKLAYTRVWTGKLFSNPITIRIKGDRRWWLF